MPGRGLKADVAYRYRDGLYLNITNRCPTACRFCIKRDWDWGYRGWNLKLGRQEPTTEEVWREILRAAAGRPPRELVWCGYGECTYRLPVITELSERARRRFPEARLRLNTIGLGNLLCGRDIAPELKGRLDAVHVSLNTARPAQWLSLHVPRPAYRRRGFAEVLRFIHSCVAAGIKTTITAVDQPGVDIAAVRALARKIGAGFRVRPSLIS